MNLLAYVATRRHRIPTTLLRDDVWLLENPQVQLLLEKIRNTGVPLKEYCGSSPLYGIKTGLNEAFIIDVQTRDRLIREDERSAEIIKPLPRGRDIDRWRPRTSNMYLIFARRGIDIDAYPAIKRRLSQFRERLEPKPHHCTSRDGEWSGRASGQYPWYELQASPPDDLVLALSQSKIVYQVIQFHSWYCLDNTGALINDKVFSLPTSDTGLLSVMCSPLMWSQLTRVLPHRKSVGCVKRTTTPGD